MLKPEKWQATFDSDGKIFGFQKALKMIVLGVCCFINRLDGQDLFLITIFSRFTSLNFWVPPYNHNYTPLMCDRGWIHL